MTITETERKVDRPVHANDPAEESIRELFVLVVTWGFFWMPIIAFGWAVSTAISESIPHTAVLPRPWPEAIGVIAAYLVALAMLFRSDRRSGLIGGTIVPTLRSAARRFAFPTTLIVGGLIGWYMAHHSAEAEAARHVAITCARIPSCPEGAARLSAGEVDVHGYLATIAR